MLLAPPFAALGALPGAFDGNVGWCLPAVAWCPLPASWGKMKFGCLAASVVLGGDTVQILGGVPENVIVFALVWVPKAAFRSRTRIPLASPSIGLWLSAPAPLPRWGLG
jgi:hypothetical protein